MYFAHAGELLEETVADESFLTTLGHQPVVISVLIIAAATIVLYTLLSLFKIKPLTNIMMQVFVLIAIGIFYMQHNPSVTAVVLSIGFVASFILAFVQLSNKKGE